MDSEKERYAAVERPQHYTDAFPFETRIAIRLILNELCEGLTPYEIFCVGNELKYRLRAGFKSTDTVQQDIGKALEYAKYRKGKP